MRDPEHRIGEVIAGRFRLDRLLGQGGMGDVFVAIQEPLGRKVALKLIRPALASEKGAAGRFEREARSLAALHHPHIVTLFDFGQTSDGELFMAMEFLPGHSLRERLRTRGALPPREALRIVDDVCAALEAAHRVGIVHRDLKPDNIMLADLSASGGPRDLVKVLDFGIARLRGSDDGRQLTQTGHIVGTPGYIAPEMITEGVLDDPRSDLYAVGVILFELLSGQTLFTAPTPVMLIMKHAQETPPRLGRVMSGHAVHPAIDHLVQRLLEKRPEHRPATAADLRAAIAALPAEALAGPAGDLAGAATAVRVVPPTPSPDDLGPDAATIDSSRPRVRGDTAPTMAPLSPMARPSTSRRPILAAAVAFVVVLLLGGVVLLARRPPPTASPPTTTVTLPTPAPVPAPTSTPTSIPTTTPTVPVPVPAVQPPPASPMPKPRPRPVPPTPAPAPAPPKEPGHIPDLNP